MPKPLHNLADAYSPIQRAEWARENVRIALANVRETLDVLNARLDDAERADRYVRPVDADDATEAFVDVADAERYALRDDYVNADDSEAEPVTRAVEHVDYAEAEAVREIHEEMALEAAGVESWDQL